MAEKPSNLSGSKKLFFSFLTFCIVIILILVLGEVLVRIISPQKLSYNITQWDPYVGFSNILNIEGYSKRQDFEMFIKINSHGLRDEEHTYQKPPKTFRIGVFGDSFTFGEGVQDNETYPNLLEDLLNTNDSIQQLGNKVEVLNFGIGKTGTSHQYALYRKEGVKYDLDMIILGFLAGNDFEDNWGGVFYLKNGRLIHNPKAYSTVRKIQRIVYYIPFYKFLSKNSHLVNLFRYLLTNIDNKSRRKSGEILNAMNTGGDSLLYINKLELTSQLILAFKKESMQKSSNFIMFNLASKEQKPFNHYAASDELPVHVQMNEDLMELLDSQNIQVIDLVPYFATLPDIPYFFITDGHLTPVGQQVLAFKIYENILPQLYSLISDKKSNFN